MNNHPFAVIFDLDGVLIDSVKYHWQAMNQVLARFDIHVNDNELRKYIGRSVNEQLKLIGQTFDRDLDIDTLTAELMPVKEELQRNMRPTEGAIQLLQLLHENKVPIAIGTSSLSIDAHQKMRTAGLLSYFETIITHDDVKQHKPDPTVYLTAAAQLHVLPKKCIVFEDAPSGISAAKNAGMKCIAISTSYTSDTDLRSADVTVHSLLDINTLFLENTVRE